MRHILERTLNYLQQRARLRDCAIAEALERPHSVQCHVFGRSIGQASDSARHMRAVPVAVLSNSATRQGGVYLTGPAPWLAVGKSELLMGCPNSLHQTGQCMSECKRRHPWEMLLLFGWLVSLG